MLLTTKQRENGWYLIIDRMNLTTGEHCRVSSHNFKKAWDAIRYMKNISKQLGVKEVRNNNNSSISFEHKGNYYGLRSCHKML